jgi:hypothetical protein
MPATYRIILGLVAALLFWPVTSQAASDAVKSAVALVTREYADISENQVVEGKPTDVSDELIRLGAIDQAGRAANAQIDWHKFSAVEFEAAHRAVWALIERHDRANEIALEKLLPSTGWFPASVYGREAAQSAFLIVQHASNNLSLQKEALGRMRDDERIPQDERQDYALLFDRVSLAEGRPQLYGTQMTCQHRHWASAPLEDSANVDALRKSVGIALSFQSYTSSFADAPPCAHP